MYIFFQFIFEYLTQVTRAYRIFRKKKKINICFFFLWVVFAVLFLTIASVSMPIWLRWGLWVSHLVSHEIRWNRSLFKWIACYTTMASCRSLVVWLIGSYKEVYHTLTNFCLCWLLWICCCLAIFTSYWLHMWSCNSVNSRESMHQHCNL